MYDMEEFQYSELDPYTSEYTQKYIMPSVESEYLVRSTVQVDGGERFGVSSVVFDNYEELIWMGNQGGHVTSYYGPTMQRYTSFQIHATDEVRHILTVEGGIYALTKNTLRHQIRRGIPKHTFKSENMVDMQCLYQASNTKLLIGGHQNKLLEIDLNGMKETVIPIQEEGCAIMRSGGGSVVTCGSADGLIILRDLRCPGTAEHAFRAHTICLSDLDMQGDLLISCGFSQSLEGIPVADPYVTVWDVRYLRGGKQGEAWTTAAASPPMLLHFIPAVSGRAIAVAGDGLVSLVGVSTPEEANKFSVFQVDTQSSTCTVMDVSSSSQALVFGDQSGHLNLFSPRQNTEPVFNGFSRDTQFATAPSEVPHVNFTDESFSFSSIPLPPLATGSQWFSRIRDESFEKKYRRPKPIDPEILENMKMKGPIGYAPNPKTHKRNQLPYVVDNFEDLKLSKSTEVKPMIIPIPKHYLKLDTNPCRRTLNGTVENGYTNTTGFPGLEPTVPNSYCNPMLQVLYYTLPLKVTLLAHTCAKEFCLSCELGFLFRTLDTSGGAPCQATNFLRAFRTVPEAAALGLILPDRGCDFRIDYIALIQSWNRFILHQMHYEILETKKKEMELMLLTQNASSPPKGMSRMGNPPIKTSKLESRLQLSQTLNGQYNEGFKFTELEYIGPANYEGTETEVLTNGFETWSTLTTDGGSAEIAQSSSLGSTNLNHEEESDISQLFAIGRHQLNRCLKCNKEEERESVVLACALQYPTPNSGRAEGRSFIDLLRASLASRRSTPAWCEHCRRFSPTLQRGRIIRLPPILAINCGGVTAHEKTYWTKGVQMETVKPVVNEVVPPKRSGSNKPCRYGMQCARPGCRFRHPDRPDATATHKPLIKSSTNEAHCVLPQQLLIRLRADGDIILVDKSESREQTKEIKTDVSIHSEEQYALSAAVVCVEDNPRNLVAFIRMTADADEQWYLFNDLRIMALYVIPLPIALYSPLEVEYTVDETSVTRYFLILILIYIFKLVLMTKID